LASEFFFEFVKSEVANFEVVNVVLVDVVLFDEVLVSVLPVVVFVNEDVLMKFSLFSMYNCSCIYAISKVSYVSSRFSILKLVLSSMNDERLNPLYLP